MPRVSFYIDWNQLIIDTVEMNNFQIILISRKTDTV